MRFNEALSLSIVRASPGSSKILYVGRRLMNLPSEGTKSEFWILVIVASVDTSGSEKSQSDASKSRLVIHAHDIQQVYRFRIVLLIIRIIIIITISVILSTAKQRPNCGSSAVSSIGKSSGRRILFRRSTISFRMGCMVVSRLCAIFLSSCFFMRGQVR
jgi:hypothetical protein